MDGFKSYSTRTVVGKFDPQFTAITGLGGSAREGRATCNTTFRHLKHF